MFLRPVVSLTPPNWEEALLLFPFCLVVNGEEADPSSGWRTNSMASLPLGRASVLRMREDRYEQMLRAASGKLVSL